MSFRTQQPFILSQKFTLGISSTSNQILNSFISNKDLCTPYIQKEI